MNGKDRLHVSYRPALLVLVAAWLVLAWPWLSDNVTVPWDAKAHFQPQLAFLAQSLHRGESPFWTPNVFAGHPQVADPQSLIFSPPYLALALFRALPDLADLDAVLYASLLAALSSCCSISATGAGILQLRSWPRSPSPSAVRRPGAFSTWGRC